MITELFYKIRLLTLAVLFFFINNLFASPRTINRSDYVAPPIELKFLNGGFAVQMADTFWLRAIQDIDHCDEQINSSTCIGKSWLFDVINLTVEFDQKFIEAYFYGALALTVIISDFAGASIIPVVEIIEGFAPINALP